MKILHINSASNWGGGEAHTLDLCRELQKHNYQVILACRPKSVLGKRGKKHQLPVVEFPLKGAIDLLSAVKLSVYCRRNKVEIIHCHLARDYWIARFVKVVYPKIKLVFTRHLLKPISADFIHKWLFAKVDRVIAVSEAVKKSLTKQGLIPKQKIVTIHNGIRIERFHSANPAPLREELKVDSATKIIGLVGQVAPHKGQEILISSFPAVLKEIPQSVLVIIGSDFAEGQYIEKLQELGKKLGIENRLYFLGLRSEIPSLLKSLDVFVLASENDAFGLVVIEAMAAGIPVIAPNTGGPQEIIINGETGLLVEPGNPRSLAEAVIKILQDPALKEKFIRQGLKSVRSLFSIEAMTASVIYTYKNIKGNSGITSK